jgi:iron-sulfur cluster repair protein YtfE (RIC family)
MITKNTTIEELVEDVPGAIKYLMEQGIRCIICGEPIWGTLEEAAKEKGFDDNKISIFVEELNKIATEKVDVKTETPIINVQKIDNL